MNPKYPVYVISKNRSDRLLTIRELELMQVPYSLVIEPQEYNQYAEKINKFKIIVLPFNNLNQGSIPARNFVWEHSISKGYERHWILDDNIEGFHRLNHNMKPKVTSGTIFKCAEDFTERYTNVALSGFNYYSFCKTTDKVPPYYLNTRIYSCILIDNKIPYRWRGIYNEDTDLSIRVLKDGLCTILFNAFLAGKVTTMRMKGGNTDELYKEDGRKKMALSLQEQHPDIAKVVWKFNRWHHQVDYSKFKSNKLIKKSNLNLFNKVNNYGMKLVTI
jgi:hypothetical protein